jgi:acetylornithine deacetylase/succinyl-diaminopimelate desuccinylase-like protein
VIGFLDTGAKKTVHFNAHYDAVPPSSAAGSTGAARRT